MPGNCLCGALWLRARHGGKLRGLRVKSQMCRHWICVLENGEAWHFKRKINLLPWPMCDLFFWGEFTPLGDRCR